MKDKGIQRNRPSQMGCIGPLFQHYTKSTGYHYTLSGT